MNSSLLKLSIGASTSVLILACHPRPTPPEAHLCETADICAEIITRNDNSCSIPFNYSNTRSFSYYNNNPNRKIYASYDETVRHLNSNKKDETTPRMVSIDPGKTATLGCWRTKGALSEQFDEWSYTPRGACYANECPAPPVTKPIDTRDPKDDCEKLCDRDDPSCLKTDIKGNSPEEIVIRSSLTDLTKAFLQSTPPTNVDVSPLIKLSNAFTGTNNCWRSDLLIDKPDPISSKFSNTGTTCRVGFGTQDPRVSSIEISFQGDWLGRFEKTGGKYTLNADDESHAPILSVLKPHGIWEYDPVILVNGSRGKMTFTGAKYYCSQLNWSFD